MLPLMIPVQQQFPEHRLSNVTDAMRVALQALSLETRIGEGTVVGIPVGSRGIRNLPLLVREVVRHVRSLGARPIVVAAMGSHGGGTAAGQLEVLRSLGVIEERVEAPVYGGTDVAQVGRTADGHPVYFDRMLLECDAILVMNRVKPHTSFRGPLESGLVKMLVVGCGKPAGAKVFHSFGPSELSMRLREMGEILLQRLPIAGAIGILESAAEQTAELVPVRPDDLIAADGRLLERAKVMLPRLPVDELDLLVVDEMGKNISGTGMDTNVIGRMGIRGMPDGRPQIQRVVVLDLSEESHGNANGVGLADLVTRRLANKIDFPATYLNTLTATFVERAKLPITLNSDREVIETALQTIGRPSEPRIIRIKNTLELGRLWVSPSVMKELQGTAAIEAVGAPQPWPFDEQGNLSPGRDSD